MEGLFRKNALDNMSTPEKLDRQVKIIRPSMWIVAVILIAGMITFTMWAFTYTITDGVTIDGVVFSNQDVVQIHAARKCMLNDVLVSEGDNVEIGDLLAVVSNDEQLNVIEQQRLELEDNNLEEKAVKEKTLQDSIDKYIATTLVKSDTKGYVQTIANSGSVMEAGDVIASVMPDNGYGYREVIAYVTDQVARSLSVGMKTQISPSFAAREEYGYMTGVITEISDFPVTKEKVKNSMGTDSYIEGIFPGNSAVEVRIKLDIDSDSDNGYKWSNPKGEKLSVGYGTQCRIIVVTDEYHPLELLLR